MESWRHPHRAQEENGVIFGLLWIQWTWNESLEVQKSWEEKKSYAEC